MNSVNMAMPGLDTVYDLTILYMSDVTNWCEYLFDIFNPFEVYQQSEEITQFPTHESTILNIKNSRVQVLIISPKFIETATSQICEITGKNSVVGLLCGVDKDELVRLHDRIPNYVNWHFVDAKDGPKKITSTTLDIVDEMIKLADQQSGPDNSDLYTIMTHGQSSSAYSGDCDHYTEMGRQPKVTTLPETEETYQDMGGKGIIDEDLYVTEQHSTCEEGTYDFAPAIGPEPEEGTYDCPEIDDTYSFQISGTLPTRGSQCTVVPDKVRAGVKEKVVVIFTNSNMVKNFDGSYKIRIQFDRNSAEVVATVLNPHTLKFDSPPELPGGYYKCTLMHNGSSKAVFKLTIQSPTTILSDILGKSLHPLNYICEVLGISPADNSKLDNKLHEQCKAFMPHGGFRDHLPLKQSSGRKQGTIFPTALHFAAKFGLPCVCAMLCQWPGADQALRIKNREGLTPDQLTQDEQLKSFLIGHKERSIAQEDSHGDIGYVFMSKDQKHKPGGIPSEPEYTSNKPNYDVPFPVAIPVTQVSKDEDIQKLVCGDADDIYNYYDSWEKSGSTMERDVDDDDDDDDTQPPEDPEEDYETLDQDQPPTRPVLQEKPPVAVPDSAVPTPSSPELQQPPAIRKQPPTDNKVSPREPDVKLQRLIEIQNRVKDKEITMDEAVILFKEWEQNHNKAQSINARGAPGDRQSSIQRLMRNFRPQPRGPLPDTPGAQYPNPGYMMPLFTPTTGISPHAARGHRSEISEKPERSPTSPAPRLHATNGNTDNVDGSSVEVSRGENGSEPPISEGPPPPRSPRPNHAREPGKRRSFISQLNFSTDYIDRPIPPIPPRISSANPTVPSNYSRLPVGMRPGLAFGQELRNRVAGVGVVGGVGGGVAGGVGTGGGSGAGGESEAIPEHSEHPVNPLKVPVTPEGIPERMAPPPPRRSSQENTRNMDANRRSSDPSVNAKEGDPTSPPGTDPTRPKRPIPRPRVPIPRPRP